MKNLTRKCCTLLCALVCILFTNLVYSQQTLTQINGWNAYVHLPAGYNSTTYSYPTIIFFPGLGEVGTNSSALISNGPGAYISQGWNGNVQVDGNTVEFIVISIQPPSAYPNEMMINEKIQTIKSLYRVNSNKLYLTGLSHGGWCSTTFVTGDNYGGPYNYASQIAAVVEVEGVVPDDNLPYPNLFDNFANSGGRLLGFEQVYDNRGMPTRINRMNATKANSGIYVQTNFGGGGHCCWNQFYGGQGVAPGNFLLDGRTENLYQWLARQTRGTAVSNQPPVANAGADKIITLPTTTTALTGTGSDADGSISSYLWTKISGPSSGTISNAASAQANLSALVQGVYLFELKVTDNAGSMGTDQVQVTVNAAANITPVANAGANQTITLPASTVTLSGSGTDGDGIIAAYQWTKMSGTGGTITNINNASTSVTGLQQGSYSFQLKVTDNVGAAATSNVLINVNAAIAQLPAACNNAAPVTHLLAQTGPGEIYRPNGSLWKGGDTVKITGTSYSVIEFNNVGGDACRPLVIMPLTTVVTPVFRFKGNCRYIKVWGGKTPYGIKVNGGPLAITSSHHIEADNIECTGGSTGVYCKQDVDYADQMTWHPNYRMNKFTFKNMWIHDISGEGMYVGVTQPGGLTVRSTWSGLDTVIIPIRLDSVEISNCIVERCAWDGIQLSNARNGNKIFGNTVRNYGTINMSSQQAGIILGGNCNGDIYNNTIKTGTGNGIEAFGYGVINIYGNTLDSCGHDGRTNSNGSQGQHSVYVSDYLNTVEVNPKQTINAYNNAINYPPTAGGLFIAGYFNNSNPTSAYNNTFCIPNAAANWQNIYLKLNVPGSTNSNNILSCGGATNSAPVANAGNDITLALPATTTTVTGTGTDANGTIAAYLWSQVSGASATIASANAASTLVSGLLAGTYKFVLKVTDNNGATATDTMQITVNSVAVTLLPASNPANTVNGIDYKYYEGDWSSLPSFPALTAVKTGTLSNFDISVANRTTQYGFSFNGYITVPADGVYTFYTTSDDGSNLLVDNVLTVSNDGLHAAVEKSGSIGLKAGKHLVTGLFFEQAGDHIFTISYEGAGISKQQIPASALYRVNALPVANAGASQNITTNTATLTGSAADPDGSISSYLWSQVSGPAGSSFSNATAATTSVTGLVQGTYQFQLKVIDNSGAAAISNVQVAVNIITVTLLPAVNPANTVNGIDYKYYEGNWSLLPSFTALTPVKTGTLNNFDISVANRATQYGFSFNGYITIPADGVYTFYTTSDDGSNLLIDNVLTVSNDGLHAAVEKSGSIGLRAGKHLVTGLFFEQAGDHIFTISYEGAGISKQQIPSSALYRVNALPVANAGASQNITTNTATLTGSAADPDGSISSYLWSQVSGPTGSSFSNATAATTSVTGLVQGTYQFQLKVTDNNGATATANTQVTVSVNTTALKIIRVNIFGGSNPFNDTKWNNWNLASGMNSSDFLYEDRSASTIKASLSGDMMVVDNGANYAASASVTPAAVLRYNSAATSQRNLTIKGLNPAKKYNLELYASRNNTGNKTLFATGSKTYTVTTDNNVNDYAKFFDIIPDNSGAIVINISRVGVWNYVAGFSVMEQADVAPPVTSKQTEPVVTTTEESVVTKPATVKGEDIVEMGANAVSVYPNPFSSFFKVQINNRVAGEYVLKLSASTGQTVFYKKVNKTTAAAIETINVSGLTGGTYILQIISVKTGNSTIHKVIKN